MMANAELARQLLLLVDDAAAIEAARKYIETYLIEARDGRMSMLACGNGFVVREQDGRASNLIRLDTAGGIQMALRAIAEHLSK